MKPDIVLERSLAHKGCPVFGDHLPVGSVTGQERFKRIRDTIRSVWIGISEADLELVSTCIEMAWEEEDAGMRPVWLCSDTKTHVKESRDRKRDLVAGKAFKFGEIIFDEPVAFVVPENKDLMLSCLPKLVALLPPSRLRSILLLTSVYDSMTPHFTPSHPDNPRAHLLDLMRNIIDTNAYSVDSMSFLWLRISLINHGKEGQLMPDNVAQQKYPAGRRPYGMPERPERFYWCLRAKRDIRAGDVLLIDYAVEKSQEDIERIWRFAKRT